MPGPGLDEGICLLQPGTRPDAATTVTVALGGGVDPRHAPHPRTGSERLLFRHLYETPVELDCRGRPSPGLAVAWEDDGDGRTWTVLLRDGAQFWDGSPLRAEEVRLAWLGSGGAARRFAAIEATNDSTLVVTLIRPEADATFLSDPALAVADRTTGSEWPLGSGAYRPGGDAQPADSSRRSWVLVPAFESVIAPTLVIQPQAGRDPRDLLDAGIDLLLTRSPSALEYAATLPGFVVEPLPWNRTYVLLLRRPLARRANRAFDGGSSPSAAAVAPALLRDLARDALQGEARPAEARPAEARPAEARPTEDAESHLPFRYPALDACSPSERIVPPERGAQESVRPILNYPQGDPDARGMAARIVALARDPDSSGALVPGLEAAIGLAAPELAATLRRGDAAAWILSLLHPLPSPCERFAELLQTAPWLEAEALDRSLIPLVQTRQRAVVRAGLAGLWVDGYGVPRLDPPPSGQGRQTR